MNIFISEFLGSFFLMLLGCGVVANVLLDKSKGQHGGWIVIAFGWAIAVFVGVYISSPSGSHINPAVSIAFAVMGRISLLDLPYYLSGQVLGCFFGASATWLSYRHHFDVTEDKDIKLAVFCTAPAIPNILQNLLSEAIGTFSLMSGILFLPNTATDLGHLNALPVALLVLGIGLSLGGPTGYAINPARDFAPRVAHFLLPIKSKRDSNWSYSWIPIVGPICGALVSVLLYNVLY